MVESANNNGFDAVCSADQSFSIILEKGGCGFLAVRLERLSPAALRCCLESKLD